MASTQWNCQMMDFHHPSRKFTSTSRSYYQHRSGSSNYFRHAKEVPLFIAGAASLPSQRIDTPVRRFRTCGARRQMFGPLSWKMVFSMSWSTVGRHCNICDTSIIHESYRSTPSVSNRGHTECHTREKQIDQTNG